VKQFFVAAVVALVTAYAADAYFARGKYFAATERMTSEITSRWR
jgi:hypothetical protein